MRLFIFIITLQLASGLASGQALKGAAAKAEGDLKAALKELQTAQSSIAGEKSPLLIQIDKLETEALAQSKKLQGLLKEKASRTRDQVALEREVKARQTEADFVKNVLNEFSMGFLPRIHISENQLYQDTLTESRNKVEAGTLGGEEDLLERFKIIDMSLNRLENVTGGHVFKGKALTLDGENLGGSFALLGPTVYFSSDDSQVNGVTALMTNQSHPSVIPLASGYVDGIQGIMEGEAEIPVDPTLGKAVQVEGSKDTVWEHIEKGGAVGYCIIGLGILSLLIAFFKLFEVSRFSVPDRSQVSSIVDKLLDGNRKGAEAEARSLPGSSGEMIRIGVDRFDSERRILEERLYEKLLEMRPKLERFLPFLAVTAAAAPLMGLLGTVMGMIKTFKLINIFGTGDPKPLSAGISEALVTTELGLVVAIPVLIIHGLLVRMAKGRIGRLEGTAMAFLNGLSERGEREAKKKQIGEGRG
ncbi:MAG: MotA/TolQ/ExbB proton channel family protein [Verrucomicrobiota bacterium]